MLGPISSPKHLFGACLVIKSAFWKLNIAIDQVSLNSYSQPIEAHMTPRVCVFY